MSLAFTSNKTIRVMTFKDYEGKFYNFQTVDQAVDVFLKMKWRNPLHKEFFREKMYQVFGEVNVANAMKWRNADYGHEKREITLCRDKIFEDSRFGE